MPSHYTVVQFVPDPVIDERMNIGVIAFSGGRVRSRFVRAWNRARGFGGQDVGFLRNFADEVGKAEDAQLVLGDAVTTRLNEEKLKAMAGKWVNSIQFTPPRASLKDLDALVDEMAGRFLRSAMRGPMPHRTRRAVIAYAYDVVDRLVSDAGLDAARLVQRSLPLVGRVAEHHFDVGVANGKPLVAIDALSFEVTQDKRLQTEVDAVAWAIDDVRRARKQLPIAVVLRPPRGGSTFYDQAKRTFAKLRASPLTEDQLPSWMGRQAGRIRRHGLEAD